MQCDIYGACLNFGFLVLAVLALVHPSDSSACGFGFQVQPHLRDIPTKIGKRWITPETDFLFRHLEIETVDREGGRWYHFFARSRQVTLQIGFVATGDHSNPALNDFPPAGGKMWIQVISESAKPEVVRDRTARAILKFQQRHVDSDPRHFESYQKSPFTQVIDSNTHHWVEMLSIFRIVACEFRIQLPKQPWGHALPLRTTQGV